MSQISEIHVSLIDPSPYQHRRYFSKNKLQELADNIKRDGLIEPIVIRPKDKRYELIAGERRWRAVKLVGLPTILSRVIVVSDLQARRMCAAENLQREDLGAEEEIRAIVEIIDAELIEDETYQLYGDDPVTRVSRVLKKRKSAEAQGYVNSLGKVAQRIDIIFGGLPRAKKWESFLRHDLPFLGKVDEDVKDLAARIKASKAKTEALQKLKAEAPALYSEINQSVSESDDANNITLRTGRGDISLSEASSNDIKQSALEFNIRHIKETNNKTLGKLWDNTVILPSDINLINGDFRDACLDIDDKSIDAIITDPPYPKDYISLYEDLAKQATRLLKPGGSLLVMCGQLYLPDIFKLMTPHLKYQWTLSYLTPGGQSPQIWPCQVNTFWKPVLWFTSGKYCDSKWRGDVIKSNINDKNYHNWGQSEGGISQLIERFSKPGDCILDPFLGGGTTGAMAFKLKRRFIGIDINPSCIETSKRRLMEHVNGQ